jgi:hypothetical protein
VDPDWSMLYENSMLFYNPFRMTETLIPLHLRHFETRQRSQQGLLSRLSNATHLILSAASDATSEAVRGI